MFFTSVFVFVFFLYNCYLAVPRPTLGHSQGDVNHCVCTSLTRRSPGASWRGWVPKPGRASSWFWTGNLPILIATPQPTRPRGSYSQRLNPLGSNKDLIKDCVIQLLWNFFTIVLQNSDATVDKTEY